MSSFSLPYSLVLRLWRCQKTLALTTTLCWPRPCCWVRRRRAERWRAPAPLPALPLTARSRARTPQVETTDVKIRPAAASEQRGQRQRRLNSSFSFQDNAKVDKSFPSLFNRILVLLSSKQSNTRRGKLALFLFTRSSSRFILLRFTWSLTMSLYSVCPNFYNLISICLILFHPFFPLLAVLCSFLSPSIIHNIFFLNSVKCTVCIIFSSI